MPRSASGPQDLVGVAAELPSWVLDESSSIHVFWSSDLLTAVLLARGQPREESRQPLRS